MNEPNAKFVDYLNSLNSYNAKGSNSYSEKNYGNEFFKKTEVRVEVIDFIKNKIESENPQTIILTGQAGDGKTSILYKILEEYGIDIDKKQLDFYAELNQKKCRFIKDFSEFSDAQKSKVLKDFLEEPKKNQFSFLVANTGPLINAFGQIFEEKCDEAKMELISKIKESDGSISDVLGYKISIVNIATIDNSYFASKFLKKLTEKELWTKCENCHKKAVCSILKNQRLINANQENVSKFIENHYINLFEHSIRHTVRSITEHLSFLITGGKSCDEIKLTENKNDDLFVNLFFGLRGFEVDKRALAIPSVKDAFDSGYFNKKIKAEEKLILKNDYSDFSDESKLIVENVEKLKKSQELKSDFYAFLKRCYIFLNLNMNQDDLYSDIFSKNFNEYIKIKKNGGNSNRIKKLILDALSMIYTGLPKQDEKVSVTLTRNAGCLQPVQFVIGTIYEDELEVKTEKSLGGKLLGENGEYDLKIKIKGKKLKNIHLNLPMLEFFEEMRNGVIETSVDPLLSHGIENIKAQISALFDKSKNDSIKFLVLNADEKTERIEFDISEVTE